ncbi:MAG: SUMF1/EgtB/PvdO family nonheme iron enzyme [Polyangiaceae bacterium]|nr:SUMF1/EgtB/PvdO family nonheme iron enzyme [Polyangiaceae bacterium]
MRGARAGPPVGDSLGPPPAPELTPPVVDEDHRVLVLRDGEVAPVPRAAQQHTGDRELTVRGVEQRESRSSPSRVDGLRRRHERLQRCLDEAVPELTPRRRRERRRALVQPQPGAVRGVGHHRGRRGPLRRRRRRHTVRGTGQTARVNRGGSWNNDNPDNLRGANRNRREPSNRNDNLGFRCASGERQLAGGSRPVGPCHPPPLPGVSLGDGRDERASPRRVSRSRGRVGGGAHGSSSHVKNFAASLRSARG